MRFQTLTFPSSDFSAPKEMYFRSTQGCGFSVSDKSIFIKEGNTVQFDTFFNSISVGTWKKYCIVENLSLILKGKGMALVKFGLHTYGKPHRYLADTRVELTEEGISIPMDFWPSLQDGLLYAEVFAITDTEITGGCFWTNTIPANDVRLGIVITHFNRKQYVLPAVERLTKDLLDDSNYSKIRLVIVDNSQNITEEEIGGRAVLIPNRNLGGSGGFTRGLLYLKDNGYTHCCFMDDDASCEIESLRRTYTFYSLLRSAEPIGLSGILLLEDRPSIIHERGGRFYNADCAPVDNGFDTCSAQSLVFSDLHAEDGNYGAWCLFTFRIADIRHLPFPFFVRGDDILFSIHNRLKILTMNGVSTWIEDFAHKESPMTRYMGFRGILTASMVIGDLTPRILRRQFKVWYSYSLKSYNYTSAKAIYQSLQDFLKGPETFESDMTGARFRESINKLPPIEKMQPGIRVETVRREPKQERRWHFLLRRYLMNGLLIPSFLMKRQTIYQAKNFGADLSRTFKYKSIYYHDRFTDTGYIVKHDKKELLKGYLLMFKGFRQIAAGFGAVKEKYEARKDWLTSEPFWREAFREETGKGNLQ